MCSSPGCKEGIEVGAGHHDHQQHRGEEGHHPGGQAGRGDHRAGYTGSS